MNILFVRRGYTPTSRSEIDGYLRDTAEMVTAAGHKVFLLTNRKPVAGTDDLQGVEWVETEGSLPHQAGHFFSDNQEYSYRVLNTLRTLSQRVALDIIEFPDNGAEGFAPIRAKRLLNEFSCSRLVVRGFGPLSLFFQIRNHKPVHATTYCDFEMEDYCARHADVVTASSPTLAKFISDRTRREDIQIGIGPVTLPAPLAPRKFDLNQARLIRSIGPIESGRGADTFVEAALLILQQDPNFRFELYGADGRLGLLDQGFAWLLARRIPDQWRDRFAFVAPPGRAALTTLLSNSCFCVFPSAAEHRSRLGIQAMASGCVVVAHPQGGLGELIQDGENGFHALDSATIAKLILAEHKDMARLNRLAAVAQERSAEIAQGVQAKSWLLDQYTKPLPQKLWKRDLAKKLSVVIPFYNQGQYLAEALQSVRDSQYPDLEIIVVNDGSTDATANDIFEKLEGVVKLRKPNGGLSSARNAGIRAATGDYVLTLDADDKIHPAYLKTAVEALENQPTLSYLTCHAQNFGVMVDPYIPVGYVPALMPFLNTDGKCANVYRREIFSVCGGYDEVLISYEDWDLLLTIHEQGLEGDVLPAEFLHYRRHYDSMVFTIADPRRVELIQYLMLKHPRLLDVDAKMMCVLLAGLWLWQATRSEAALKREERMLSEEPWKVLAQQAMELRAQHDQAVESLGAQHALALAHLEAHHAEEIRHLGVEQIFADGVPVKTQDMSFVLKKYLRRKFRWLVAE